MSVSARTGRSTSSGAGSRGGYAKGRATQEEIITTAILVFADVGYHGASLRDIAARVGISHPGLLHHFLIGDMPLGRPAVDRTGQRCPTEERLPFDLPRSTAAVEKSRSDVPFDTADPLFRFGDGEVLGAGSLDRGARSPST